MEQVPGSLAEMLPPCALHVPPGEQCGMGERGVPGLGSYTPSEAVPARGKGDPNPQLGGPWRSETAAVHSGPPQGPCTFCELRGGLGVQEGSPKGGACCAPPAQKCFGAEDRKQLTLQPFGGASRVAPSARQVSDGGWEVGAISHMLKAAPCLHFKPNGRKAEGGRRKM